MKKKKKHSPGEIVLIVWTDAESLDEWEHVDDKIAKHNEKPIVNTVGIVLQHTDEAIIVARSIQRKYSDSEGTFSIPAGMIIESHKWPNKIVPLKDEEDGQ